MIVVEAELGLSEKVEFDNFHKLKIGVLV